ncbi:MAG: DNA cytosine methyltransferase [Phycisphaerales bacterium]
MASDGKPIAVDLFSGAGGMSLGFQQAGFEVAAAFDYNQRCVDAHAENFLRGESAKADLSKATGKELRKLGKLGRRHIDALFGGPPCGGFSIAGQRDPDDPRNKLLLRFAALVDELRPSFFVVENVRGLLIGDAMKVLERFRSKVEKAGYEVAWPVRILNAADYGVPQKRERIFILGCKSNLVLPEYPEATTPAGSDRRIVVADAIDDLALIDKYSDRIEGDVYTGPLGVPSAYSLGLRAGADGQRRRDRNCRRRNRTLGGCEHVVHTRDAIDRFKRTKPGTREAISRMFRLADDGLSPTLRAGTDLAHGKFTAVRPIHYRHARCITVREAARLHSFPDWFSFHPTKWHGFMQIGNSVPPLLAKAVARSVLAALKAS